ncbi:hypothetical protein KKF86_08060 [bacterium]|nr:hypothetical protein [bacterium]
MKKLIFIIVLIALGFGQISSTKHGIGLNIGDRGAGIFYHRHIKSYDNIKLGATIRWLDVRPPEEIPSYNYYTGQYENKNTISLAIFPLFGVLNYYPFEGKIANNFSPYISTKLGPVLVLNADANVKSFFERWFNANSKFTYGGNIAVGVEFRQPGKVHYSVEFSYDLIPLSSPISNYNDLNGTVLSFSIHR